MDVYDFSSSNNQTVYIKQYNQRAGILASQGFPIHVSETLG